MITNESTEKRIFDAMKFKKWHLQYEINKVKHDEIFEFLTIAQLRMMQLEAMGIRTTLREM
jgi:hypothetical protein